MENPEREKLTPEKEESSEKKGIFESRDETGKSETAQKIEALKKMRKLVEQKEPKEFVGLKEAEKILGQENVLGPEDVEKYMLGGRKFEEVLLKEEKEELEKIKEIPYSKEDLEKAKDLGEMLVLRSSLIIVEDIPSRGRHNRFLPNIAVLRRKFPEYFSKQGQWFSGKKQEQWFSGKNFFIEIIKKFEWKLVRREPLEKGATYTTQENWMVGESWTTAVKKQEGLRGFKRRKPVEIVYDTLLYWLKNGKPPFENASDWSSEKLSPEKIVRVGILPELVGSSAPGGKRRVEGKIVIGLSRPNHPGDALGVCPQR